MPRRMSVTARSLPPAVRASLRMENLLSPPARRARTIASTVEGHPAPSDRSGKGTDDSGRRAPSATHPPLLHQPNGPLQGMNCLSRVLAQPGEGLACVGAECLVPEPLPPEGD